MRLFTISLALALVVLAQHSVLACQASRFDTVYDFHDQATTVVLVKIDKLAGSTASLTVVETLKGSAARHLTLTTDLTSTCSPGMKTGEIGVIFLDGKNHMLGLYDGFERDTAVIQALRGYSASPAADRAKALLAEAVSADWSGSYNAAHALANRIELVRELDAQAKDLIIARLGTLVHRQHPLMFTAARLHDARMTKLFASRPRSEDDAALLGSVVSGAFESERDTGKLADAISGSKSDAHRVAAMERCEQVRKASLARFTEYTDPSQGPDWNALADACRSGKPIAR
jgi:hypothetical protein